MSHCIVYSNDDRYQRRYCIKNARQKANNDGQKCKLHMTDNIDPEKTRMEFILVLVVYMKKIEWEIE